MIRKNMTDINFPELSMNVSRTIKDFSKILKWTMLNILKHIQLLNGHKVSHKYF